MVELLAAKDEIVDLTKELSKNQMSLQRIQPKLERISVRFVLGALRSQSVFIRCPNQQADGVFTATWVTNPFYGSHTDSYLSPASLQSMLPISCVRRWETTSSTCIQLC